MHTSHTHTHTHTHTEKSQREKNHCFVELQQDAPHTLNKQTTRSEALPIFSAWYTRRPRPGDEEIGRNAQCIWIWVHTGETAAFAFARTLHILTSECVLCVCVEHFFSVYVFFSFVFKIRTHCLCGAYLQCSVQSRCTQLLHLRPSVPGQRHRNRRKKKKKSEQEAEKKNRELVHWVCLRSYHIIKHHDPSFVFSSAFRIALLAFMPHICCGCSCIGIAHISSTFLNLLICMQAMASSPESIAGLSRPVCIIIFFPFFHFSAYSIIIYYDTPCASIIFHSLPLDLCVFHNSGSSYNLPALNFSHNRTDICENETNCTAFVCCHNGYRAEGCVQQIWFFSLLFRLFVWRSAQFELATATSSVRINDNASCVRYIWKKYAFARARKGASSLSSAAHTHDTRVCRGEWVNKQG